LSAQSCAAHSRARASAACAIASGERRVPSLIFGISAIAGCCPNDQSASGKPEMRDGETLVLGIESSCDETAAALVTGGRRILAQRIASQEAAHAPYGGVVPEIAARAHAERLAPLIGAVLDEADIGLA